MLTIGSVESLERERAFSDASSTSSTGDSGVAAISVGNIHSALEQQAIAEITNLLMLKAQQLEQILDGLWQRFFITESFRHSETVNSAMNDAYTPVKHCVNAKRNPSSMDTRTYDENLSLVQSYSFDNPTFKQEKPTKTTQRPKQQAVTKDDMMIFHYKCALQYYMEIMLAIENYKYLIIESAERRWGDMQSQRDDRLRQHNANIALATKRSTNYRDFVVRHSAEKPTELSASQNMVRMSFPNAQQSKIESLITGLRLLEERARKLEIDVQIAIELKNDKILTIGKIDKVFEARKIIAELIEHQKELKKRHEHIKERLDMERKKWFGNKGYIHEMESWLSVIETEFNSNDFIIETYKQMYETFSHQLLTRYLCVPTESGVILKSSMEPLKYLEQLKFYENKALALEEQKLLEMGRDLETVKSNIARKTTEIKRRSNEAKFSRTFFEREQDRRLAETRAATDQYQKQLQEFERHKKFSRDQQRGYEEAQRQLQTMQFPLPEPGVIRAGILRENNDPIVKWQRAVQRAAENLQSSLGEYSQILGNLQPVRPATDPINAYLERMKLAQQSLI